ncbi:MAG: deoxyguanosinetriphosphate triphosphohydrolase, partial [Bacillota bacterium]|nr:deoxyguanosinetriphosphate triphosphohydrolase [Bacillota bacterium]
GILNHTSKGNPCTLEGQVVSLADRIAYVNHDIDDALRSGLLSKELLPHDYDDILGVTHGSRINALVADVIENSAGKDHVAMSARGFAALNCLRDFLFSHLYRLPIVLAEEEKSANILQALFGHYVTHLEELPEYLSHEEPEIQAKDYIAGMTDQYAVRCFEAIYIPKGFL